MNLSARERGEFPLTKRRRVREARNTFLQSNSKMKKKADEVERVSKVNETGDL